MRSMKITLIAAVAAAAAATSHVYTPIDSTTYTYLGTGGCRGNGACEKRRSTRLVSEQSERHNSQLRLPA